MIEEKKEIDSKSDLDVTEPPAKKARIGNVPTQELGVFEQVAALVRGQLINADGQKNYFGQKSIEDAFSLVLGDEAASQIENLIDKKAEKARPFSDVYKDIYSSNSKSSKVSDKIEGRGRNVSSGAILPDTIIESKGSIKTI